MDVALYIALGVLAAAAVGMQVWMLKSASVSLPQSRRPLAAFLRVLNIVLIVIAAGLVVYVLAGR